MKIALQKWNIFPRKLHDYSFLMVSLDFKEKKGWFQSKDSAGGNCLLLKETIKLPPIVDDNEV